MYMIRINGIDNSSGYEDSFFDTLEDADDAYENILNDTQCDVTMFITLYRCFVDAAYGTGTIYLGDRLKSDIIYPSQMIYR